MRKVLASPRQFTWHWILDGMSRPICGIDPTVLIEVGERAHGLNQCGRCRDVMIRWAGQRGGTDGQEGQQERRPGRND